MAHWLPMRTEYKESPQVVGPATPDVEAAKARCQSDMNWPDEDVTTDELAWELDDQGVWTADGGGWSYSLMEIEVAE